MVCSGSCISFHGARVLNGSSQGHFGKPRLVCATTHRSFPVRGAVIPQALHKHIFVEKTRHYGVPSAQSSQLVQTHGVLSRCYVILTHISSSFGKLANVETSKNQQPNQWIHFTLCLFGEQSKFHESNERVRVPLRPAAFVVSHEPLAPLPTFHRCVPKWTLPDNGHRHNKST